MNQESTKFNAPLLLDNLKGFNNMEFADRIFVGDCLNVLHDIPSNSVDLVYLDPPFFSNRYFEVLSRDGLEIRGFEDRWRNGIWDYIEWMRVRLKECHRVLKKSGSLYLHCDWHASHYLKVELDMTFGYRRFRNEIIWKRHNSHNDAKQGSKSLGKVHDTIFLYAKSSKYTWHTLYKPYDVDYIRKFYRHIEPETKKRYALGDLSGPGGRSKGNPYYTFKGVARYWRFSEEKMKRLDKEGRILQRSEGAVPVLKRYLDDMKGLPLQDTWSDIKPIYAGSKDAVQYPTQKPTELLERIVQLSSNEGDIILDPFCGSGTSLLAAMRLNRRSIGIDMNENACLLASRRLERAAEQSHSRIDYTYAGTKQPILPGIDL